MKSKLIILLALITALACLFSACAKAPGGIGVLGRRDSLPGGAFS